MPLRNRVLPDGRIIADAARGTFTGNRGILVDRDGQMMRRQWAAKAWITCLLDFRGRRRPVAQSGTWTELFFLDEAVAFAAGHRPCAYCRRADYTAFKTLWGGLKAPQMDAILHDQRLDARQKRLHPARMQDLPDGAFVLWNDQPHLLWNGALFPYTPAGYGASFAAHVGQVQALTPPATCAVLAAGYRPRLHSSALGNA